VGGCGGGSAVAQAVGQGSMKMDMPMPTQGGGTSDSTSGHAHGGGAADAKSGAGIVGQTFKAWGTNATFAAAEVHDQMHHGSMAQHVLIKRTSGNDTARAQRVMQAAMKLLAPLKWGDTHGKENDNQDHRVIPESVKAQWKKEFPDLPVPNLVVFDKKSQRPVGALFVGGEQAKDLGMGTLHQHNAGGAIMQHMWFIPNNMDLAFSDTTQKQTAIQAALAA
jgi:hypothetical protein